MRGGRPLAKRSSRHVANVNPNDVVIGHSRSIELELKADASSGDSCRRDIAALANHAKPPQKLPAVGPTVWMCREVHVRDRWQRMVHGSVIRVDDGVRGA